MKKKKAVSRQAIHAAQLRAIRVAEGKCRDCGKKSKGYRCDTCNASRREAARLLMKRRAG